MNRKWILFLINLIVFGFMTIRPVMASGIQMKITPGFGGYVIPEHWVPVQVQISTTVESGRIEVIPVGERGVNHTKESYALLNMNRIEFPVFASEGLRLIKIKLYSGEQLLTEHVIDMKKRVFPGHLVLAVNVPSVIQQKIENSLLPVEPVLVVPLNMDDLPSLGPNYDGVSGILLNNPKVLLTPAQITSIHSWLTGGGRMMIFNADQDFQGILTAFKIDFNQGKESRTTPIGFGSITLVQNDTGINFVNFNSREKFLTPKPYRETIKLGSDFCFHTNPADLPNNLPPFPITLLVVSLGVWAGTAFLTRLLQPSKFINYLLVITLVEIIFVYPIAGHFISRWQRGVQVHNRAVILPNNGGALVETDLWMKFATEMNLLDESASPWGVDVSNNNVESGNIHGNRQELTLWRHKIPRPFYTVRWGSSAALNLVGWFPNVSLDKNLIRSGLASPKQGNSGSKSVIIPVTARTIAWDGKKWFSIRYNNGNYQWIPMNKPPRWLKSDQQWLTDLQMKVPGSIWVAGYSILPREMRLQIQSVNIPEVIWVMPCFREDLRI